MSEKIHKIFYINLDKRIDRKQQIEKNLNEFGLKYERFKAIETYGFGILGCGLSHLEVLKIAKKENYENVLILEDDFTFIVSKEMFENELIKFFNLNLNYDVLFLSYNVLNYKELNNNVVNKVIDSQTASGYIVHKNYYDKLIQLFEKYMPILQETKQHWLYANDMVWKQLQENDNWFYFINRIGKQTEGYSDNCERIVYPVV